MTLDDQQFLAISKAVADPKRYEMLRRIAEAPEAPTCTSVTNWTKLSPATVSHHLKELDSAGLVKIDREGKFHRITLNRETWAAYLKRLAQL